MLKKILLISFIILLAVILSSCLSTNTAEKANNLETSVMETTQQTEKTEEHIESTESKPTESIAIVEQTGKEEEIKGISPTIELKVYEGPNYSEKDDICYYRIKAIITGEPAPNIEWSKDNSNGSLGEKRVQINLKRDESYTLVATATNSIGSVNSSIELVWGCKQEVVIDKTYINYANPIAYNSDYIFEIIFNYSNIINSINAYIPTPSEWDSQKNIQLFSYSPGGEVKADNINNKFIGYSIEDMSGTTLSMAENFNFTCYEIITDLNIEKVPTYNKSSSIYKLYTKDENKIETNYFKTVTPAIVGGESNVIRQARIIYDYIIGNIGYVPQGGFLRGAKFAYESRGGECGDYSALFVAMARSIGIPARTVVGFWAEPSNGSTHVWAEFYVQDIGWIPVDPTIGQTGNREYYFGNMDNKRLIMSKGYNLNLNGNFTDLFQIGSFWWYGTGDGPTFNFQYNKR